MTIFMLSLGGIPPTAGFFGKFYVFRAALEKPRLVWLVVIAVLNSVVSVYYYLRVVTAMYFREVGREVRRCARRSVTAALLIAALGALVIGILPTWLVDVANARHVRAVAAPALAAAASLRSRRFGDRGRNRTRAATTSRPVSQPSTVTQPRAKRAHRRQRIRNAQLRPLGKRMLRVLQGARQRAEGGPCVTVQSLRVDRACARLATSAQ